MAELGNAINLINVAKDAHESGDLALAKDSYKELAQYVAPKRKAIEHSGQVETNKEPLVIIVEQAE